jgi:hypothetical protein
VRPKARDIAVPPFAPGIAWIGSEPKPVERICAQGPLVVHFVDVAHVSSVRTLPYLKAWAERYQPLGLSVIGVNSPRFPFTADPDRLRAALEPLGLDGVPFAVDDSYRLWHAYGCEGWPSLFLWGRGGALRWVHFGEGEYQATETAIREELEALHGAGAQLPDPMTPLRPSDAAGALVAPPSDEVFPGGSVSEPWLAAEGDPRLELDYSAGEAWASVDGRGSLGVSLDDRPEATVEVDAPGAHRLASHVRHESHHLSLRASPGLSVYSIGFGAGVPAR